MRRDVYAFKFDNSVSLSLTLYSGVGTSRFSVKKLHSPTWALQMPSLAKFDHRWIFVTGGRDPAFLATTPP